MTNRFSLQQVDASENDMVVYNTQPEVFPMHQHTKGQLTYFEGGSSHLHTLTATYFVPTNHLVWIPSGIDHFFTHFHMQKMNIHTVYVPIKKFSNSFFEEIGIFTIHPLMKEVLTFAQSGILHEGENMYNLLESCIHLLPQMTNNPLLLNLPHTEHRLLKRVLIYINEHLSDDLSLPVLAHRVDLGVRTFMRLFQKEIGLTVHEYIRNARIMKSIEYILEDHLSLSEIAYEVGYTSLASFSNSFFNLTAKRPSDFKSK